MEPANLPTGNPNESKPPFPEPLPGGSDESNTEEKSGAFKVGLFGVGILIIIIAVLVAGTLFFINIVPKISSSLSSINKPKNSVGTTTAATTTTQNYAIPGGHIYVSTPGGQGTTTGVANINIKNVPPFIDLEPKIIALGTIDRATQVFTPSNTITSQDRAGLQFQVSNHGNTPSGAWTFVAQLPSDQNGIYWSGPQPSIPAFSKIVFTLGFDAFRPGTVVVNVDPNSSVKESNEQNNTVSANY